MSLEIIAPGAIFTAIGLIILGILSLWRGWVIYSEPTPRFVIGYRGWSSTPLALPYGGGFMLCLGIAGLKPILPQTIMFAVSVTCFICFIIFMLGFLIWFPRFLLPRWYRRAVKAGVPRNDPNAMGAFKALPLEQQREAARQGNQQ